MENSQQMMDILSASFSLVIAFAWSYPITRESQPALLEDLSERETQE